MYEERKYRKLFRGENLVFFDVTYFETDLRIGASKNLSAQAMELILRYREQLEGYIRQQPEFLTSLIPIMPPEDAPWLVKNMCSAAKSVGVGPMAAVAGAFAEMVGKGLLEYTEEVIVENGGDIFIKSSSIRKVGIYAGKSPLSEKMAIEVRPECTPLGICTSAGTIGHSLSFGKADAAVIVSKDTFLADAAATMLGNLVKGPGDIENALDRVSEIKGIDGALVVIGDKLGAWGDIKLVPY